MADDSSSRRWDAVYAARPTEELGWYEPVASTLPFVLEYSDPGSSVIDIGGGDSRLIDGLIAAGRRDITVLDLSEIAMERARCRVGPAGADVSWVVGDVTDFGPSRTWDLWHDRAVFHFLTDPRSRAAYRTVAREALAPGGRLVVATFGPDGPNECAGLPVARYDVADLVAEFGAGFELVTHDRLGGGASGGDQRPYTVVVLSRA